MIQSNGKALTNGKLNQKKNQKIKIQKNKYDH